MTSLLNANDLYEIELQDSHPHEKEHFSHARLKVLSILAAISASEFVSAGPGQGRESCRRKALEYIGKADKIEADSEETSISKALFWIGEAYQDAGEMRNAAYYADFAASHKGDQCASTLRINAGLEKHVV